MRIDNDTTTLQIAELMGSQADERDGRILLGLLSREYAVDTDEITDALLSEAAAIRRAEDSL